MKKLFALLLASLVLATSAAAAPHITVVDDAEVIDNADTQDKGGSGQPIQIMEEYGCGYSSLGDKVVFNYVDFGPYGAESASMHFGYGGDVPTTLAFYVDDEKVLDLEVTNTGGWTIADSGWVDVPLAVPAGVHNITVEFTNDKSGSLSELKFNEAWPEAYIELTVVDDAVVIDNADTQDKGGSGQPIQIMEEYGCGYSSLGDQVVFESVNFGDNGASGAKMHFGYGGDVPTTLAFYVDGEKVLDTEVGNTGGWTIADSGWVTVDLPVPAGVHDIAIEFTNDKSGSVSELAFFEAEPAPVEETVDTAPQTFDAGVIAAAAAIVSAAGYALSKKR